MADAKRRYARLAELVSTSTDLHDYLRSGNDPQGRQAIRLCDRQDVAFAAARDAGCSMASIATAMGLMDGA